MTREYPKNNSEKIALPTVGRIVYFYYNANSIPVPAIVVQVFEGALQIETLTVFNLDGRTSPAYGVRHKSDAQSENDYCWDWMPFQKGQAAKTEQLQAELGKLQSGAPSPVDGKR